MPQTQRDRNQGKRVSATVSSCSDWMGITKMTYHRIVTWRRSLQGQQLSSCQKLCQSRWSLSGGLAPPPDLKESFVNDKFFDLGCEVWLGGSKDPHAKALAEVAKPCREQVGWQPGLHFHLHLRCKFCGQQEICVKPSETELVLRLYFRLSTKVCCVSALCLLWIEHCNPDETRYSTRQWRALKVYTYMCTLCSGRTITLCQPTWVSVLVPVRNNYKFHNWCLLCLRIWYMSSLSQQRENWI